MSAGLFTEWFYDFFVPKVEQFLENKGLPKKAIQMCIRDRRSCMHPFYNYEAV